MLTADKLTLSTTTLTNRTPTSVYQRNRRKWIRDPTALQHPCSPQTYNYITTLADKTLKTGTNPTTDYKIKCYDCQASYIGETGRNLNTRLTEHKRATRNGDANNHIALHHQLTNHNIDWDTAQCLTYSTNYFQRLTLESWYTNLEQTPLNRCQPLPASYKRFIHDVNEIDKQTPNRPT